MRPRRTNCTRVCLNFLKDSRENILGISGFFSLKDSKHADPLLGFGNRTQRQWPLLDRPGFFLLTWLFSTETSWAQQYDNIPCEKARASLPCSSVQSEPVRSEGTQPRGKQSRDGRTWRSGAWTNTAPFRIYAELKTPSCLTKSQQGVLLADATFLKARTI